MNWRKKLTYPLLTRKNGSNQLCYLSRLERSQYESPAELRLWQEHHLQALLQYAQQKIPYYADKISIINHDLDEIKTVLRTIPLLSKREIQENGDLMVSPDYQTSNLMKDKTGGSTASPLEFYYTADRFDWRKAAEIRHNRWAGYDIGTKCAILWGARQDFAGRQKLKGWMREFITGNLLVLDASSITEASLVRFTDSLQKFKPEIIQAYANTLAMYARYLEENGIKIPRPKAVITSAEVLSHENRKLIERILGTRIYNRYGCREFSVIASECQYGNMHVNDECLYLEFLKEDGNPCAPGEEGEIVITDLLNHAMPMIRYRIGDTGIPVAGECPCCRGLSIMKMGSGRVTDFIETPAGRRVSGVAVATYVITRIEGLAQVQFVQKGKTALVVKVVKNGKFNERTVPRLAANIADFLDEIPCAVEIVENIPPPASGKMQFCIRV